jgi:TetR/AcrR family fatty acid metabolism transcriptional regulator
MRKKEANTRDRIIKNASKLFAKKGFFKTTVDDIAQATGVAKGTVYLYFKNKQELYTATIDAHFSYVLNKVAEIETKKITATEKMKEIAVDFVEYVSTLKTSYMPFSVENVNLIGKTLKTMHSIVMPKINKMNEVISRIVEQGIKTGEFRDVEPRVAAFYFLSTIRAIFVSNYYISDIPVETDTILKLFFQGLKKRR